MVNQSTITMLHLLKRQFFTVSTHFDYSLVLSFALPKSVLAPLLPPGLEVDNYGDYGFVAVAIVKVRDLKPDSLPGFFKKDCYLVGYRIFVRYSNPSYRKRRGLYILKSFSDSRGMVLRGNTFTRYNYAHCQLESQRIGEELEIKLECASDFSNLKIKANISETVDQLPSGSPFPDLRQARRFEGPMPYTFSYEKETHSMSIVRGVRRDWKPRPIAIKEADFDFLRSPIFQGAQAILANAFIVENIPYRWEKAVREPIGERRNSFKGVFNIFRFNWQQYVFALLVGVLLVCMLQFGQFSNSLTRILKLALAGNIYLILSSLIVSFWIYDRSGIYNLSWLKPWIIKGTNALNIHAGFDETSKRLQAYFPKIQWRIADFFDQLKTQEPSLKQARALHPPSLPEEQVDYKALPYTDESFEAVTVLFSAHEIRSFDERVQFFKELKRILKQKGKVVVTEHLRDWRNLLAFGPGFLHFFSERSWRNVFKKAGFSVTIASRYTPFVMVFVLDDWNG